MAGAGLLFTVTVCESAPEQPLPSVTVTLYVAVATGDTVMVWVMAPVDQR